MQGNDPCPHCGNRRMAVDSNGLTVSCEQCGCIWQLRLVLISKGGRCEAGENEYGNGEDEEETGDMML